MDGRALDSPRANKHNAWDAQEATSASRLTEGVVAPPSAVGGNETAAFDMGALINLITDVSRAKKKARHM